MHKIKLKDTKTANYFINLIGTILIIFTIKPNITYGSNNNWIEVSKTKGGVQYWDSNSLINKDKGIIEITTKYLRIDVKGIEKNDENIYTMEINCLANKYKDISVNGKDNVSAKWEDPNGDKLLNDVISDSCENV